MGGNRAGSRLDGKLRLGGQAQVEADFAVLGAIEAFDFLTIVDNEAKYNVDDLDEDKTEAKSDDCRDRGGDYLHDQLLHVAVRGDQPAGPHVDLGSR